MSASATAPTWATCEVPAAVPPPEVVTVFVQLQENQRANAAPRRACQPARCRRHTCGATGCVLSVQSGRHERRMSAGTHAGGEEAERNGYQTQPNAHVPVPQLLDRCGGRWPALSARLPPHAALRRAGPQVRYLPHMHCERTWRSAGLRQKLAAKRRPAMRIGMMVHSTAQGFASCSRRVR